MPSQMSPQNQECLFQHLNACFKLNAFERKNMNALHAFTQGNKYALKIMTVYFILNALKEQLLNANMPSRMSPQTQECLFQIECI